MSNTERADQPNESPTEKARPARLTWVGQDLRHTMTDADLTGTDEHMLLASAANLQKALKRFRGDLPSLELPAEFAQLLRHLRNIYEHWEDYKPHVANRAEGERSGKSLKELAPNAMPWALEIWPGDDIKIARVLSMRELETHLRALKKELPAE